MNEEEGDPNEFVYVSLHELRAAAAEEERKSRPRSETDVICMISRPRFYTTEVGTSERINMVHDCDVKFMII